MVRLRVRSGGAIEDKVAVLIDLSLLSQAKPGQARPVAPARSASNRIAPARGGSAPHLPSSTTFTPASASASSFSLTHSLTSTTPSFPSVINFSTQTSHFVSSHTSSRSIALPCAYRWRISTRHHATQFHQTLSRSGPRSPDPRGTCPNAIRNNLPNFPADYNILRY